MAKKTGEKETVGKAKGFEIPIDEESAGKLLDTIYRSALNGVPKVSRSVDEMVADYTGKAKSPDDAAKGTRKVAGHEMRNLRFRHRARGLDYASGRNSREHKQRHVRSDAHDRLHREDGWL